MKLKIFFDRKYILQVNAKKFCFGHVNYKKNHEKKQKVAESIVRKRISLVFFKLRFSKKQDEKKHTLTFNAKEKTVLYA